MKLNNRFIFGILSLVLAAVIAFVALPTIARQTNGKTEIVRITQPVLKGEKITSDNAEVVEVGGYNLPSNLAHSMEDVARYVSRLVVMNHGEKVFDGTPKEVFRHYKELEAIGLAAPQITYVVHKLIDKGIPLDPDITTVEEAKNAILKIWREKNGKSSGNAAQVSTAGADSENAGHGNAAGTASGNADITEKTAGEEKTC